MAKNKELGVGTIVLEENDSEYVCVCVQPNGATSTSFLIPKVKPLIRPQRKYRKWEDDESMRFVGSNNSEAKECDFWHRRGSSIDELEPDYFVGDAIAEWKDICHGI